MPMLISTFNQYSLIKEWTLFSIFYRWNSVSNDELTRLGGGGEDGSRSRNAAPPVAVPNLKFSGLPKGISCYDVYSFPSLFWIDNFKK